MGGLVVLAFLLDDRSVAVAFNEYAGIVGQANFSFFLVAELIDVYIVAAAPEVYTGIAPATNGVLISYLVNVHHVVVAVLHSEDRHVVVAILVHIDIVAIVAQQLTVGLVAHSILIYLDHI